MHRTMTTNASALPLTCANSLVLNWIILTNNFTKKIMQLVLLAIVSIVVVFYQLCYVVINIVSCCGYDCYCWCCYLSIVGFFNLLLNIYYYVLTFHKCPDFALWTEKQNVFTSPKLFSLSLNILIILKKSK